ncbi:hypothetical protein KIW84_043056 [Lathyrus oleraceus]|uniref:Uncharacterized protein n=1 Tax=Pisum sativum TaxID=3888 RepID=A0A9D4XEE7_PEA|nr:hypothetical protein KIW84_043056 [Pisum sativum]
MSSFKIPWSCLESPVDIESNHNATSTLPQGDRLAIVIPKEEYIAGVEACKHNLHRRIIWPKGTGVRPLGTLTLATSSFFLGQGTLINGEGILCGVVTDKIATENFQKLQLGKSKRNVPTRGYQNERGSKRAMGNNPTRPKSVVSSASAPRGTWIKPRERKDTPQGVVADAR